jgi:hypothetical protein
LLSVGTHLVVRLLTFFAVVLITVLFVSTYYQLGLAVALAALAGSGLSIVGLASLWDKVKEPVTKRLEYLNERAFSPILEWCRYDQLDRINPDPEIMSNALADLKTHRRYMTVSLFPKTLLRLVNSVVMDTAKYIPLWKHLYDTNMDWIQHDLAERAKYSTMPDMRLLLLALGLLPSSSFFAPDPAVVEFGNEFLKDYETKNPNKLASFVFVHKALQEEKASLLPLLDSYMRTNMLRKQPPYAGLQC